MNTSHFEELLKQKRQDLTEAIARLEENARDARSTEVGDEIDEAVATVGQAAPLEQSSRDRQTLKDVDDALQRIADGTYGKCLETGEQISEARLEAVPWAKYSLAVQQKHDEAAEEAQTTESSTLG